MVGEALDVLIPVARSNTHQSRRVANFLLAWWNGPENGDFPIVDVAATDRELGEAMVIILLFLAQNSMEYADLWARRRDMEDLIDQWRGAE
jgi:hypothetical protein